MKLPVANKPCTPPNSVLTLQRKDPHDGCTHDGPSAVIAGGRQPCCRLQTGEKLMKELTDNEREILDDIVEMGFVPMSIDRESAMLAFVNPNMLKGIRMKTIYKYEISIKDSFVLEIPAGAQVLALRSLESKVYLFVLVDPRAQNEIVAFRLISTGYPVEDGLVYLDTLQYDRMDIAFHLFRKESA